jgi:hypothetical protein
MSESNNPQTTELKQLMRRVLESDASEAFERFVFRQVALRDMAPSAHDALVAGIEDSPDGGEAMAEAYLEGLPQDERELVLRRANREAGRRLHAAALALLAAARAAHLSVEITPEMVALAAVTELGDLIPDPRERS